MKTKKGQDSEQKKDISDSIETIFSLRSSSNAQVNRGELYNIDAERAVLGTIILNNQYLDRVSDILLPEHFYEPAHSRILTQIRHQIEKSNLIANNVTLKNFFDMDPVIQNVGGSKYLSTLLSSASVIIDIASYARLIHDLSLKRGLVMVGEDIVNNVYNTEITTNASDQVEAAEAALFHLVESENKKSSFRKISVSVKEAIDKAIIASKNDSHINGITTGLIDLDNILNGMQSSDLIILAGRPSMGKTALAINIGVNACKALNRNLAHDQKESAVGFFSLEMSADQLSSRILSIESSINASKFRTGKLTEEEWEILSARSNEIANLPFYIDDTPALSISAIRTKTRRMVRKFNLKFLIIDYLQLVRPSGRVENRVQEIAEITQGLKAIAKEFNIPVLALSQLSRDVEKRDDKRPLLSDLRESGTIEQDSDVVAFIYRESYYLERKRPSEDEVDKFEEWKRKLNQIRHMSEVIIAKQRNGPVGSVHLYFDSEFTRFTDWINLPQDVY